jgi:hypothetical protein
LLQALGPFHEPIALLMERRADIHEGFLRLGCAMICWRTPSNALPDPFCQTLLISLPLSSCQASRMPCADNCCVVPFFTSGLVFSFYLGITFILRFHNFLPLTFQVLITILFAPCGFRSETSFQKNRPHPPGLAVGKHTSTNSKPFPLPKGFSFLPVGLLFDYCQYRSMASAPP